MRYITVLFCTMIIHGVAIGQTIKQLSPSIHLGHQVVEHSAYILEYNEKYEQAEWVIYLLTKDRVAGSFKRKNNFRSDPKVRTGSASLSDYRRSGYDRGHLAPAGDMKWSKKAMSESFFMSNMSPQIAGFNRGIWRKLESIIRKWAVQNEELYVVTGAVLTDNLDTIGKNRVGVPDYYYKIILDYKQPELKGIGFVLPNQESKISLNNYAVTIDSIEHLTGIDFFHALEDRLEENIESRIDITKWFFNNQNKN